MAFNQIFENPTFGGDDDRQNDQSSRAQTPARKAARVIQFVNIDSPMNGGLAKNNKLVRSHVMRHNRRTGRTVKSPQSQQASQQASPEDLTRYTTKRRAVDASQSLHATISYHGDTYDALPDDVELQLISFERFICHCQLPFHVADGQAQSRTKGFITAALSSELLLNVVLAVSLTSQPLGMRSTQMVSRIARHKGRASKLLLDSFANAEKCTSDESIAAVYLMAIQDLMISGSAETYEMHMQGLYRMAAMRGGLDSLGMDGLLKTIVLWADQYKAIYLGVRPHYCVPPRPEHMSTSLVANACYHGTRKLWRQGLVEKDLVYTCEGLNELMKLFEKKAAGEDVDMPVSALLRQRQLLEDRLRPAESGHCSLEPVVSAAARMYVAGILSRMPFGLREEEQAKLPRLSQDLKESIMRDSMDEEWAQCVGFLLWVFFTGSLQDSGSELRQWLLVECQSAMMRLRFGKITLGKLKFLIQGYVWSDTYCDAQAQEMWMEAFQYHSTDY